MVTPLKRLGEEPAFIDCPHCEKRTKTKVEKVDSSQTSLAAAFCCLCCGVITVFIPFLCHWCADIDHRCYECGKQVAHRPHDGQMQEMLPQEPVQKPSMYIDKK
ncbi:uncharacterized protein K460DRAFT_276264 [Cucurbitaria berberidis CBS 394.84]|uniref:LITAF domain-containing protein n=1 Tax=Cucurbitaria berberidis CBS 394.84 TaxID=1168544 RepID=A0A9P4LB05_9PLEO|nr:uncharacterized protein K460DRAFT_276264 [Cucurbitaria berberidis CBS 394.84]KAF1849021.1 hypothetical protein K460DRAFT_276264 [Cucurbitaria berberidis CBS 394.84]